MFELNWDICFDRVYDLRVKADDSFFFLSRFYRDCLIRLFFSFIRVSDDEPFVESSYFFFFSSLSFS